MSSEILSAIKQIANEKGISAESVLETIESALAAAFRKDFGNKNQNIKVEFDSKTGGTRVFDVKEVVENPPEEEDQEIEKEVIEKKIIVEEEKSKKEVSADKVNEADEAEEEEEIKKFNPRTQIGIDDAKKIKKTAKIGDELKTELEVPGEFGRMAAQTAKQVIIQKLREAERQTTFDEFKDKEHTIITGTVQRREGKLVLVDLGRATGLMLPDDQIRSENYVSGARFKFYISSVSIATKGPEILLSRTHPEIVRKMFELEIPEIDDGSIEIKAVAREAGSRSKIAVESKDENIDPIGSCVGQRGTRVQTIISELGGEKIDIIEWNENPEKFIINALSPAKISSVKLNEKEKTALVTVKSDQLSLAIGKGGQNVRLAARLTEWKIDIAEAKDDGEVEKVETETAKESAESVDRGETEEVPDKTKTKNKKLKKEDTEEEKKPAKKTRERTKNDKKKLKKKVVEKIKDAKKKLKKIKDK